MTDHSAIRVWDAPTRLFHWSLLVLFGFSWWSAEQGMMDWHRLSGSVLLGLFIFRLVWGLIGGSTARFAQFVAMPWTVLNYLNPNTPNPKRAGHNPLGGYSVLAMLALIGLQLGTGMFAVDVDGLESGPLSHLVSFDEGRAASAFHGLSFNLLLAVIGFHILAILFYRFVRRRNLVTPMITGRDRELSSDVEGLRPASLIALVAAVAIAGAGAWYVSNGLSF